MKHNVNDFMAHRKTKQRNSLLCVFVKIMEILKLYNIILYLRKIIKRSSIDLMQYIPYINTITKM